MPVTTRSNTSIWRNAVLTAGAVAALGLSGCKQAAPIVDDQTLTASVQQKIATDSALAREPIQVSSLGGTVSLTGAVSNSTARALAANDAASTTGVLKVINDITVSSNTAPATTTTTAPLQQIQPQPNAPSRARVEPAPMRQLAPVQRSNNYPQPAPPPARYNQPPAPQGPQQPVTRTVTLPAGSTLPVRVTQTLDSATTQQGENFTGSLATDIVQDGMLLMARGTPVSGRVDAVQDAGHFSGSSLLTVELTGIDARGQRISVSTDPYTVQGKGRGENTAIKTGVGAAAGAILGGILGGGKGAAIGAAAGGGTGAGINAVTRGQQVQIPSETVVRFHTTNGITVRTSTVANSVTGDPTLQNR